MTDLDYREVWFKDKIVGAIAQDIQAKIYVRAKDKHFERILKSFISPIKVDETIVEGDVSVSNKRIVLINETEWISVMEQGIPPNFFVSMVDKTNLIDFNKMDF